MEEEKKVIARKRNKRSELDKNSRKMLLLMPKYVRGCKDKLRSTEKKDRAIVAFEYLSDKREKRKGQ